jgi:hypothetical protein
MAITNYLDYRPARTQHIRRRRVFLHWRVSAKLMATTLHQHTAQWVATPDPEAADWIAFDALTEADVLAWVWASVDKDCH